MRGVVMRATCFLLILVTLWAAGCRLSQPTPLEQAMASFRLGEWDGAIRLCDQVLSSDPRNAEAWLLRGRCQLGKGLPEKAIEDYTRALNLRPEDPEPWYHRAIAYAQIGKPELAAKDNHQARQLDIKVKLARASQPIPPLADTELADALAEAETNQAGVARSRQRAAAELDPPAPGDQWGQPRDPLAEPVANGADDTAPGSADGARPIGAAHSGSRA